MRRVCFVLRVRPDLLDHYVERHADVWPELRAALAAMARTDVNARLPDENMTPLPEIFHLD